MNTFDKSDQSSISLDMKLTTTLEKNLFKFPTRHPEICAKKTKIKETDFGLFWQKLKVWISPYMLAEEEIRKKRVKVFGVS